MKTRQEYNITPCTKPRMTQKDKWNPSEAAKRYFAYRDEVKYRKVFVPVANYHITFILPMPKSWSEQKKQEMDGQPHQQVPDKDNLEKGLLDAIYGDDSHVWDGRVTKRWGRKGQIIVEIGE